MSVTRPPRPRAPKLFGGDSMSRVELLVVVTAGILAACVTAHADTVTLGALKDNTLYESPEGALSNGAGQYFFAGETGNTTGGKHRRGLVAFDVGGIPATATITGVSLTLHMSRTVSGPQNIRLHRVLADWGEGTSDAGRGEGGGTTPTTKDATWVHRFFTTETWSSPGGDFDPTPSATLSVNQQGDYTWSGSGLVADVQSWVNGTAANFGWILVGNEVSITTAKRFDSRENTNAAFRPRLVINYTGSPIEAWTWSVIKRLYR